MPDDPPVRGEHTEPDAAEGEPKLGIGDRVGRYELLGMLGEGGMSYVYLAHDPQLDRDVALKLMRVRIGKEGARRLHREALALAKLSHPNVVPVYDAGLVGGQAFVAMEYVAGKTLRTWLRDRRPWREVVRVMADAGRGLAAAHARGIIHRDFKPENVLLGDDGRVRVLDFGLARLAGVLDGTIAPSGPSGPGDSMPPPPASGRGLALQDATVTRADQLIGTPAYMAPEQLRRDPVDERTDIFAFGVTFYEALFGVRPFDNPAQQSAAGSNAETVTTTITDVGLRRPRRPPRGTDVPRHVQRIVSKALAYEPGDRCKSVGEILDALARDPYRAWKRAGAAAIAVAAAGVLAGAARMQSRQRTMCHGGAARLEAAWGSGAQDAVRAAFAKTHLPYAQDAAQSAARQLDDYVQKLARQSDQACAATRLRGEQSEDALELRMACYETRWREVEALVGLFQRADEGTVEQAAHAAGSLGPIDDCADTAALRTPTPRPRDPQVAARLDAIEQRLATVMATHAVGKSAEAAAMADALVEEARSTAFVPLVARVDFWRGRAYADLSEEDKSIPAFRAAFTEALASHEDRVLGHAAARLAQEYIYTHRAAEFDAWADVAQAAVDRGPRDDALQSFVDHTRCVALYDSGKMFARLACLEKHAARVEPARPLDEWELTTLGLAAVDAGKYDRGLEYVRRGYEHSLRYSGALHPRTLEMRMYQCKAQIDAGDYDAGLATCGATLRDMEQVASDNRALVARARLWTALALIGDKKYEQARAELQRARAAGADASDAIEAEARIDTATGQAQRALPHFRAALEQELRQLPPEHPDVVVARLELGKALLDHGDVVEARAVLGEALAAAERAEIAPASRADVEFAAARAMWAAGESERPRALELARGALALYAGDVPKTQGFVRSKAEVEQWLAKAK